MQKSSNGVKLPPGPWKVVSAEKFRNKQGEYVFPFVAIDRTPGGQNLGRIEWHIEPFIGKKRDGRHMIETLWVWATQTHDRRYQRVIFEIPCYSECLYSLASVARHPGEDPYMSRVWRMMFCEMHKTPVFSAYPDDEHTHLKINVGSSIMIESNFLK